MASRPLGGPSAGWESARGAPRVKKSQEVKKLAAPKLSMHSTLLPYPAAINWVGGCEIRPAGRWFFEPVNLATYTKHLLVRAQTAGRNLFGTPRALAVGHT